MRRCEETRTKSICFRRNDGGGEEGTRINGVCQLKWASNGRYRAPYASHTMTISRTREKQTDRALAPYQIDNDAQRNTRNKHKSLSIKIVHCVWMPPNKYSSLFVSFPLRVSERGVCVFVCVCHLREADTHCSTHSSAEFDLNHLFDEPPVAHNSSHSALDYVTREFCASNRNDDSTNIGRSIVQCVQVNIASLARTQSADSSKQEHFFTLVSHSFFLVKRTQNTLWNVCALLEWPLECNIETMERCDCKYWLMTVSVIGWFDCSFDQLIPVGPVTDSAFIVPTNCLAHSHSPARKVQCEKKANV